MSRKAKSSASRDVQLTGDKALARQVAAAREALLAVELVEESLRTSGAHDDFGSDSDESWADKDGLVATPSPFARETPPRTPSAPSSTSSRRSARPTTSSGPPRPSPTASAASPSPAPARSPSPASSRPSPPSPSAPPRPPSSAPPPKHLPSPCSPGTITIPIIPDVLDRSTRGASSAVSIPSRSRADADVEG